ncbi:tryptophan halogenase family protein [Pseudomarimonas arenosa]|uniref:Tryptophan 7-halogenase n=1 Tax=Pseudomarimonas arenosa TaxID=2774145 RepID=A0AAW3ZQC7_9GAMM|nr:tryptophan halogenase family protein [Pseudomarimonas arenosa]MBD8526807.1 tryptophan 7-halogenase [Pseudomarimonas arenosa]
MSEQLRQVLILGGGSAGWLTAGLLAAEFKRKRVAVEVTVLESPDVPTIGVGEGTWPTMRDTLRRIEVSESDFIRECDAAFKQGSKFVGWARDDGADAYYHPFLLPHGFGDAPLAAGWLAAADDQPFAELVCPQPHICEAGLAPKQITTPEFAAVANYAYHLNAGKLGEFLRRHCVERLGVRHLRDHMLEIQSKDNGDVAALVTREHGALVADLFIDCSGTRSLLLGQHLATPWVDASTVLFNDRAMAVQAAYPTPEAPIPCQTVSTAHDSGWIWDIALSSRRGIGVVYSSAHCSDEQAEIELRRYVQRQLPDAEVSTTNRIAFAPGYRQRAFVGNCVAIGLAAGFVEPLEASSLVLVELAATALAEQWPNDRSEIDMLARRFNEMFSYRWQRVIDFLKLHYLLSSRAASPYWREHREAASVPESLAERMRWWHHHAPSRYDLGRVDEVFPSASYQYVLYGMGFRPCLPDAPGGAVDYFKQNAALTRRLLAGLPQHRSLIEQIKARGLPTD